MLKLWYRSKSVLDLSSNYRILRSSFGVRESYWKNWIGVALGCTDSDTLFVLYYLYKFDRLFRRLWRASQKKPPVASCTFTCPRPMKADGTSSPERIFSHKVATMLHVRWRTAPVSCYRTKCSWTFRRFKSIFIVLLRGWPLYRHLIGNYKRLDRLVDGSSIPWTSYIVYTSLVQSTHHSHTALLQMEHDFTLN